MRNACFFVQSAYCNNRIFDLSNKILNRDNCLYPFSLLFDRMRTLGFDLHTQDLCPPEDSEIVIYNEMPTHPISCNVGAKKILLLFETEAIMPNNWNFDLHKNFDAIFTWNDCIVDNVKYFKLHFPYHVPINHRYYLSKHHAKAFVMIAGNKMSSHTLELYSERLKTIQWFENAHPGDFDLYGNGWDLKTFTGPRLVRALNRVKILQRAFAESRPSYCGRVESKLDTLSEYRFSVCYENVQSIPGYITEKIFDCFLSGSIPIYWGPPNIDRWIPRECFVNREDYPDHESLYLYAMGMTEGERQKYLDAALAFIYSPRMAPFTAENFVSTICQRVSLLLNLHAIMERPPT